MQYQINKEKNMNTKKKENKSQYFDIVVDYINSPGIEPAINKYIADEVNFWSFVDNKFPRINKDLLKQFYDAVYLYKSMHKLLYSKDYLSILWRQYNKIEFIVKFYLDNNREEFISESLFPKITVSPEKRLCLSYKKSHYEVSLKEKIANDQFKLALSKIIFNSIQENNADKINNYLKNLINEILEKNAEKIENMDVEAYPDFTYLLTFDHETKNFPFYIMVNNEYKIQIRDMYNSQIKNFISEQLILLSEKEKLSQTVTTNIANKDKSRL